MKKKKRRGISIGTVVMLLLTVITLGLSLRFIPLIAGQTALKLNDAQSIVSAITENLSLPELTLSDIPIFQTASQQEEKASPAPTFGQISSAEETPTPAPSLEPTPTPLPQKRSFSLTAAGAFAVDRTIASSCYYKESETYDFSPLLNHIADAVSGDLKVFTFENLIVEGQKLSDLNAPPELMDAVKEAGFDLAFLGTEKAMNLGLDGLGQTMNALKGQGFSVAGAYETAEDAGKAVLMDINGVQVAVLHYTETIGDTSKARIKKENAAFALPVIQAEAIASDIAAARGQGAQVVIVSAHWGNANTHTPTKAQLATAQRIADAGADVILGAHSQAVQPIVYLTGHRADGSEKQTLVAYSLGALMTSLRESVNIASVLLHVNISYNPVTQAVAFEEVSYSPVYFWRHKDDGRTVYDAVLSAKEPPENMAQDQITVMERALKRVNDTLKDSVAVQR